MQDVQLNTTVASIVPTPGGPDYNAMLVDQWVRTKRTDNTQEQYRRIANRLLAFVGNKQLDLITLDDLLDYVTSLSEMQPSSITIHIMAIKSLYKHASKLRLIPYNLSELLVAPSVEDKLAEKIMDETDVIRMIALETNARNHAMLRFMYATGLRVSEVVSLEWSNIKKRENGGQVAVYGKGGKTRYVVIGQSVYDELASLGEQSGVVFKSRKGAAAMDRRQVTRIVAAAAERAGIPDAVSAHWLRHANASHALENGASVAVVQSSLGHKSLTTTTKYTHARPNDGTANYIKI